MNSKVNRHSDDFADSEMRGKLVAVIGDENTCTGFLLAGVGETNKGKSNFFVVDSETPKSAIEECFTKFMDDDNVAVVVINQVSVSQLIMLSITNSQPKLVKSTLSCWSYCNAVCSTDRFEFLSRDATNDKVRGQKLCSSIGDCAT